MNLDDGLRIMDRDLDCLNMTAVVPKFQFFKLYVHHVDLYNDLHFDDACIIGSPSLPKVLSPKKPVISGQNSMRSPRLKTMVTKGNLMHG